LRVRGNKGREEWPGHELDWVSFHTFCHTWATWMRRYGGLDTRGLVGTGRWKSEKAAERYNHVVVTEETRPLNCSLRLEPVQNPCANASNNFARLIMQVKSITYAR
jgi:hypothetical protein